MCENCGYTRLHGGYMVCLAKIDQNPVTIEKWRTIEVPQSIRDHFAFDELCKRLEAVGVRVVGS